MTTNTGYRKGVLRFENEGKKLIHKIITDYMAKKNDTKIL